MDVEIKARSVLQHVVKLRGDVKILLITSGDVIILLKTAFLGSKNYKRVF